MRMLLWIGVLSAALGSLADAQPVDSYRTAGAGMVSSQGLAARWQHVPQRRRTLHASGFAIAGALLLAAMAGSRRR